MQVLAIDPGNEKSGWVIFDPKDYKPSGQGVHDNDTILDTLLSKRWDIQEVVIEGIQNQGRQYVGQTVFDTCVWIGKFELAARMRGLETSLMYRTKIKSIVGGKDDAEIRQSLIRRFGDKGTKAKPGWFYGFATHAWQAYALGVAYTDEKKRASIIANPGREDKRWPQ